MMFISRFLGGIGGYCCLNNSCLYIHIYMVSCSHSTLHYDYRYGYNIYNFSCIHFYCWCGSISISESTINNRKTCCSVFNLLACLLDATIAIFQPMNWYNPGSVKLI